MKITIAKRLLTEILAFKTKNQVKFTLKMKPSESKNAFLSGIYILNTGFGGKTCKIMKLYKCMSFKL